MEIYVTPDSDRPVLLPEDLVQARSALTVILPALDAEDLKLEGYRGSMMAVVDALLASPDVAASALDLLSQQLSVPDEA